jgi:hypothetical protein
MTTPHFDVLSAEELRAALADLGGQQRIVIATIDPELAREMLTSSTLARKKQTDPALLAPARPADRDRTAKIIEAIRRDPQPRPFDFDQIGVFPDGALSNGRNMLHAIIDAGRPVQVGVILNVELPDFRIGPPLHHPGGHA